MMMRIGPHEPQIEHHEGVGAYTRFVCCEQTLGMWSERVLVFNILGEDVEMPSWTVTKPMEAQMYQAWAEHLDDGGYSTWTGRRTLPPRISKPLAEYLRGEAVLAGLGGRTDATGFVRLMEDLLGGLPFSS